MLMGLLKRFIREDLAELNANGVRVRVIGQRDNLKPDIVGLIVEAETLTANNRGLTLTVAFNYGGRQEIFEAARRLAIDVRDGRLDARAIGADELAERLDTAGLPDPDLIIRTSGEMRLSNFLLWQAAYAELVFLPDPLARFRRRGLSLRARPICGARTPFWRRRRTCGCQVGVVRTCAWR